LKAQTAPQRAGSGDDESLSTIMLLMAIETVYPANG